jgi:hypothetical protein
VHGAGVLLGRRVDQHRLQAAGLGVRADGYAPLGGREERQKDEVKVNLEPGNPTPAWWAPSPASNPGRSKSRHRRQAHKAQSAVGGIVRKIIQVTRVIVVLLIAWQFPGSL